MSRRNDGKPPTKATIEWLQTVCEDCNKNITASKASDGIRNAAHQHNLLYNHTVRVFGTADVIYSKREPTK